MILPTALNPSLLHNHVNHTEPRILLFELPKVALTLEKLCELTIKFYGDNLTPINAFQSPIHVAVKFKQLSNGFLGKNFLQDQWTQLEDCDHTTYLQQMSFWRCLSTDYFRPF